ncbi:MAG TPA: rod shape-determining protein MreD [Baekduia sp.]|uniref:rod shape-determining protein MreD n=1 Tax=Baekduia sp. TaxID=2600305 RepID=UPI002D786957|nr:rod shape-determining protein MreD [Baekduia sp.]HET6508204.1 rod shape-determining protein MreD [Baekduia sp.]
MVVSPQLIVRLVLLGLAVVILQVAAVSQVVLFGATADLTPLAVAAVGLMCGSITGALFGFFVGLFFDAALVQTLGLTSLVCVIAGYGAGRLRELRDPQATVVPMIVGAVATAITTFGYGLMNFMLGIDAPVSFLLLRVILATIVFNAIIAVPVFALIRRCLGPALPDDPRRRRRRAYTTGGLSPLSRA